MKTKLAAIMLALSVLLLSGCSVYDSAKTGCESNDPVERGLSAVALAIFSSAIIRALFNK